jgi:fructose-specific phosphotransferase system IIC component
MMVIGLTLFLEGRIPFAVRWKLPAPVCQCWSLVGEVVKGPCSCALGVWLGCAVAAFAAFVGVWLAVLLLEFGWLCSCWNLVGRLD